MVTQMRELLDQLRPDSWREQEGFSPDMERVHEELFQSNLRDREAANVINKWIGEFQPCVFGRIASRLDLISYCVLNEQDLQQPDEFVRDKIQESRLDWLQRGLRGEKSAFVIVAVSKRITYARPDDVVKRMALRLCELYLLREIELDRIYLDSIELELTGKETSKWRWDVGVNYFCAQGDGRWWNDHRIPGSMAFSMNSVGHLVKSGKLAGAMRAFEKAMSIESGAWRHPSLDSLERALVAAMQTIDKSSVTESGRATTLLPLPGDGVPLELSCPVEMPPELKDKDYCEYEGFYHTDQSVPSVYFLDNVQRPGVIEARRLDFTYLFDDRLDNVDYINVGRGRRVSAEGSDESELHGPSRRERVSKRARAKGQPVTDEPKL